MRRLAEQEAAVEEKIDGIITLLSQNEFDADTLKHFQRRFNNAIERKEFNPKQIDAFKAVGAKDDASREELLDEFSMLFLSNKIDSEITSKYIKGERMTKLVMALIGTVMITLGFAMVVMPATHEFEMYTIYYFSPDDGITLMDLISLTIILAGVYVLVRAFYKKTFSSN